VTLTVPRAPRRVAATALAGLALLPLAACGGDDAAGPASPDGLARLAPASAPFYIEAAVRPEGELKADLDALIGKFAPGESLDKLSMKAVKDDDPDGLNFERDIKPWLGERAGLVITGLKAGGDDVEAAGIIETTDPDKAIATLRDKSENKLEDAEYNGVKYVRDTSDMTVGAIVDEALVIGTEPAFKAVVDTSKGKGLDTNAEFKKVVDAVDENALAFIYGDVTRGLELAKSSGQANAQQLESVRELLTRQGLKTVAAGFAVTDTAVKIRFASGMKDNGQGEAAAATLAALPAGSWAAFGLGDLGKSLTDALDGLKGAGGPGSDVQSGLDLLEQQAGIDVQKDLISWMGQTGIFVRGASLNDIGGALVIQSKDPAATKAAMAKARTLVAGGGLPAEDLKGSGIDDGFSIKPGNAPVEIFVALAGERFVLAANRAAFDEAINPAKKLEDDEAFKAAGEQLGDGLKPTFYLDFPKVTGLIGLAAGDQPGYAQVKTYLDKIGTIVAGSKREGDLQLQTVAVGVK